MSASMKSVTYTVKAIERDSIRVSRHGISCNKGGRVLSIQTWQYPDTPYYLSTEIMQHEFPSAQIVIKVS